MSEQPNDSGATSGTYTEGSWTCIDRNTSQAFPVNNDQVVLVDGSNVACTITNSRDPKVHIIKTAADPIVNNPHIGKTIRPNPDGTLIASYVVTVYNTSGFVGNTGPVNDYFVVPAGLVWDGDKTATITYRDHGNTGTTLLDPKLTATESELATGLTLARSVQNMPAGTDAAPSTVSFLVEIPLKLDLTSPAPGEPSPYEVNQTQLAQCQPVTSAAGNYYDLPSQTGIPNGTSIADEDTGYSTIHFEDNFACVPVQVTESWRVEKSAQNGPNPIPQEGQYVDAGTTGPVIQIDESGLARITYRIRVTNESDIAMPHPAVTDTLTLPPGFSPLAVGVTVADGTSVNTTDVVMNGQSAAGHPQVSFVIPPGVTPLSPTPPANYVDYFVTLMASADMAAVDWSKAGLCDTESSAGDGNPDAGGFFNWVRMEGDAEGDPAGTSNNDGCVPVQPPTQVITILKVGTHCDVGVETCPLGGAEFAIYGPDPLDPTKPAATPIQDGIIPDADGSTFTSTPLQLGEYWLVETQAPDGHSLLAEPIHFRLDGGGIFLLPDGGNEQGPVSLVGSLLLEVENSATGSLPAAGGEGFASYLTIGLLLILGAGISIKRTSRSAPLGVTA